MHTYATTKELKKKPFKINSWNIIQTVRIQVSVITEKKLKKEHFLPEKTCLLGNFCVHFESLLGREYTYVWHD